MNSSPSNGPLPNATHGTSPLDSSKPSGVADKSKLVDSGPAFRALFEKLQEKAAALQESSKEVADPAELRGAVDTARATLQDALSLGDQVLEAFRGAQHVNETAQAEDKSSERTPGPRTTDAQRDSPDQV